MSRYLTKGFDPSDLKPCPFCGGEAEWRDGSSTKPYIRCKGCGMRTGGSSACDKLKAAWNRRPAHDETCKDTVDTPEYRDKTRFECSVCGYEYNATGGYGCDFGDEPWFNYCPNCGRKVVGN